MPSSESVGVPIPFIRDILAAKRRAGRPAISFEFFPTKTPEGERTLLEQTIPALGRLAPDFCSVTYGAGGGTRDKTLEIVNRIQCVQGLPTIAHLTCVNATREETQAVLQEAQSLGIHNILALRGDPPGGGSFVPMTGGFEYSYQLVQFIRQLGEFSIGVAGFPEGHIACTEGKQVDWQRLKHKVDQGADFVITQLFFDNRDYLEFRDYVGGLGLSVPIIPGILPILSTSQIKRFTALSGAALPLALVERLERCANDAEATEVGIEYATKQCEELLREGAPGLHFYTLNKARSTTEVLRNLGIAPSVSGD